MLRLISKAPQGLGISQLATKLDISKGTVHGIISSLEAIGALIRNPASKKYTLGPTLFELGKSAYADLDMRELARPVMEKLAAQTGTSVFIGIPNGRRVTILDIVESNRDLKITAPRGSTIPLMAGAIGKVFLAVMDKKQAQALIGSGLPRFTEHTVTDPNAYLLQIQATRKDGYGIDDEEYIDGVRAAAAPIQGIRGASYAIWAVGFKSALNNMKMAELITDIQQAAREINDRIKHQPLFNPPSA